jgi:hypothetical protein
MKKVLSVLPAMAFLCLAVLLRAAPVSAEPEPDYAEGYELSPAGYVGDDPFYIAFAFSLQAYIPDFGDGKNFVTFDDKYGREQERLWIWFPGGMKEVRIYALEETDDWDNLKLEKELFSADLGPDDVLEFLTQVPEGAPPHNAVRFDSLYGPRAYALGYNGRTGEVNPVQMKLR